MFTVAGSETDMRGNRARPFEARRIVNGSLEVQRCNRPNTRHEFRRPSSETFARQMR